LDNIEPYNRQRGVKRIKSEKVRNEHRLNTISDLYASGWRLIDIAEHLNLSTNTISADLNIIRARWLEKQTMNFSERQALELEKLDKMERELWEAWEKSKKGLKRKTGTEIARENARGQSTERIRTIEELDQPGDVKYLELIHKVIAQRSKMLGLDAPTVIQHTGELALNSYNIADRNKLSDEQKTNLIMGYLRKIAEKPEEGSTQPKEAILEGELHVREPETHSAIDEGNDLQGNERV
jgi:hypothetical protein